MPEEMTQEEIWQVQMELEDHRFYEWTESIRVLLRELGFNVEHNKLEKQLTEAVGQKTQARLHWTLWELETCPHCGESLNDVLLKGRMPDKMPVTT